MAMDIVSGARRAGRTKSPGHARRTGRTKSPGHARRTGFAAPVVPAAPRVPATPVVPVPAAPHRWPRARCTGRRRPWREDTCRVRGRAGTTDLGLRSCVHAVVRTGRSGPPSGRRFAAWGRL